MKAKGSKGNEKRLHFSIKQAKIADSKKGKFRNKPMKIKPGNVGKKNALTKYARDHFKRQKEQGL